MATTAPGTSGPETRAEPGNGRTHEVLIYRPLDFEFVSEFRSCFPQRCLLYSNQGGETRSATVPGSVPVPGNAATCRKTTTFFISTVSNEFRSYRNALSKHLDRADVRIETQESLDACGDATLLKLDHCIQQCDAVIRLVGDQCGSVGSEA